jgi:hypothetical protein
MSLPVPSASNGYAITADHVNNHVLWSAVLGELHSRLQAAEAALADYEAAVSVEALAIAQGAVDDTIGPQIATLQDTIAALNLSIAAAEDQLAALQSGGVAAANVPVSSYGIIPGGSNADQAFAILVDAIAATADARAAIVAAIPGLATQAEARAGTNNTKFASPLRVREARLMRSNVQSTAYTAAAADFGLEITCSSTWTLGLTAAATLGDGWYCYVRNIGSGVITIDPNGSETIDGATTLALKPGAVLMIHCDGATFRTFGKSGPVAITDVVTISGSPSALDFTSGFEGSYEEIILKFWGLTLANETSLKLLLRNPSGGSWQKWAYGGVASAGGTPAAGTTGNTGRPHGTFYDYINNGISFTGELRFSRPGSLKSHISGNIVSKESSGNMYVNTLGAEALAAYDGFRLTSSQNMVDGSYQLFGVRAP